MPSFGNLFEITHSGLLFSSDSVGLSSAPRTVSLTINSSVPLDGLSPASLSF